MLKLIFVLVKAVYVKMWTVYTDGSASPNPGPGGAGAVILHKGKVVAEIIHAGGNTTNNKMELEAIIMSFSSIPQNTKVLLYTDSEYVQKGLTEWSIGWVKRGWKTAANQPVKNQELWQKLLLLCKEFPKAEIKWIKAHQDKLPIKDRVDGWEWNVRADELANTGTERSKALHS